MTAEHDRGELRLALPKYENFIAAQDDIQALIRKYDKNGDSNLDDEELTGLLQEVTLAPCAPARSPPFGCPAPNTPSACCAISPLWSLLPPTIQCLQVRLDGIALVLITHISALAWPPLPHPFGRLSRTAKVNDFVY